MLIRRQLSRGGRHPRVDVESAKLRRFCGKVAKMFTSDFLSIADLSASQLGDLFDLAADLKAEPAQYRSRLDGRTLALIFQKPSTRTRVSFDVGMGQLGGRVVGLSRQDMQLGRGETVADTARVLSRYVDGIAARIFAHEDLEEMATAASVPVINALTDDLHPCQALADYFTLREVFGELAGLELAYVGDGNNMAHSLLLGAALLGVSIRLASPVGYEVDARYLERAQELAEDHGARIVRTQDPDEAVAGCDAVYTDVWTSMGQEEEADKRLRAFEVYQVDRDLMARAKSTAIFLHCLPLHRGEEVSAEVADGPQSRILDQAENRLHVQKALLLRLLDPDGAPSPSR